MTDLPTGGVLSPSGLLLRERVTIVAALVGVTGICWFYLWLQIQRMTGMGETGGSGMDEMAGMVMSAGPRPWSAAEFALMFIMWWIMMVGMMAPSATPMILTFATVNRRKRARGWPYVSTATFAAGYLMAWGVFSLAATLAQWGLELAALISRTMQTSSPILGGVLFLAAGLYQFTPAKHECLKKCRSPLDFVLNNWRDGSVGALRMGLGQGFYCVGCCWLLMLLLFVGGVMNLLWVAGIAAFVFAEKLVPGGEWIARVSGALMLAFCAYLVMHT
jgi:predicted metal-binding membrane protein